MFTKEELAGHSGQSFGGEEESKIMLAVLGSVFDVTKGKKHYGPGGAYSFFTGKDASRSFVTGVFRDDPTAPLPDDLSDLTPPEVKEVFNWLSFYQKDYTWVGKLVGPFYTESGTRTEVWRVLDAGLLEAERLETEQKAEQAQYPQCNSKWSQAEGGLVWCTRSVDEDLLVPRQVRSTGSKSVRCACVPVVEAEKLPGKFAPYPGCPPDSPSCVP